MNVPEIDTEVFISEESYIRYLTGVAILHDPSQTQSIHGRETGPDSPAIVLHAERLMYDGLKNFIRLAAPKAERSNFNSLEQKYEVTLPNMLRSMVGVYQHQGERVRALNPAFEIVRPFPFKEEPFYRSFCHSRLGKIGTLRLMDGIAPAKEFEHELAKRTLRGLSATDDDC